MKRLILFCVCSSVIGCINSVEADILVCRYLIDEVHRYSDSGEFLDVVVKQGTSPLDGPTSLELGPDGCLYVASRENDAILKYSYPCGQYLGNFTLGVSLIEPRDIEFGPDGNLYLLDSNILRVFDIQSGAFISNLVVSSNSFLKLRFVPDTQDVLICGFNSGVEVRRLTIDFEKYEASEVYTLNFASSNSPRGFALGPGQGTEGDFYISTEPNQIQRYDVLTGAFQQVFAFDAEWSDDLEFGPDGDLYSVGTFDSQNTIDRYDGKTGVYVETIIVGLGIGQMRDFEFVPDGFDLGDVNRDGCVDLLDVSVFVDLLEQGVFQFEADVNQDGQVNLLDVQPFVDLLLQ